MRGTGQALAEFAIVLPILLVLILGVFDFGRLIFVHTAMTNAAREGARLGAVNQDVDSIEARVTGQMGFAEPVILVNFYLPPDPGDPPTAACPVGSVGCLVVVEVASEFDAITPVIGTLIGTLDLSASSTATVEFACPRPDVPGHPFSLAIDCQKQP
jgi:hypothetical protein